MKQSRGDLSMKALVRFDHEPVGRLKDPKPVSYFGALKLTLKIASNSEKAIMLSLIVIVNNQKDKIKSIDCAHHTLCRLRPCQCSYPSSPKGIYSKCNVAHPIMFCQDRNTCPTCLLLMKLWFLQYMCN